MIVFVGDEGGMRAIVPADLFLEDGIDRVFIDMIGNNRRNAELYFPKDMNKSSKAYCKSQLIFHQFANRTKLGLSSLFILLSKLILNEHVQYLDAYES